MNFRLKTFVTLIVGFLLVILVPVQAKNRSREESLRLLNEEIRRSGTYVAKQEQELKRLRGNLRVATSVTDRYLSMKQIVDAYAKFNSDSALFYLKRCEDLAVREGNKLWLEESMIKEAFIYADRGDDFASEKTTSRLPAIEEVAPSLQRDYAKAVLMKFLKYEDRQNMHQSSFFPDDMWARYSVYLRKNDVFYLLLYPYYFTNYDPKKMEKRARETMKHVKEYSFDAALGHFVLYNALSKQGRDDEAFAEIVLSAICDIRNANRSSSSLIYVAELLSRDDDCPEISDDFIALCLDNVDKYKDVGRSVRLLKVQKALEEKQRSHDRRYHLILTAIIIVLFVSTLALTLYHLKRVRQARRGRAKRIAAEQQAAALTVEMTSEKEQLAELQRKESERAAAIVKFFTAFSVQNRDAHALKKDLSNYLQTGMQRKAKELLNKSINQDASLSLLYAWFDESFLSLRPDFVEQMNKVLKPECQVRPEDKKALTPELRIYALLSLGVSDSSVVAETLHYSTQTIYNYRRRMKQNLLDENFDLNEYVVNLYKNEAK